MYGTSESVAERHSFSLTEIKKDRNTSVLRLEQSHAVFHTHFQEQQLGVTFAAIKTIDRASNIIVDRKGAPIDTIKSNMNTSVSTSTTTVTWPA